MEALNDNAHIGPGGRAVCKEGDAEDPAAGLEDTMAVELAVVVR